MGFTKGDKVGLAVALIVLTGILSMALTATPVFVQTPRSWKIQISGTPGTTPVVFATPAAAMKITGCWAYSTDTAARSVRLDIVRSATAYTQNIVAVNTPVATPGTNIPVNLLANTNFPGLPLDSDGNPYILLESTDTLQAAANAQLTAATFISITCNAADF